MVESWLVDLGLGMGGIVLSILGLVVAVSGWKHYTQYKLVTGTRTSDILTIDSEGPAEFEGTISSSADSDGFVSPTS